MSERHTGSTATLDKPVADTDQPADTYAGSWDQPTLDVFDGDDAPDAEPASDVRGSGDLLADASEGPADLENRRVDAEILGKSVRTKLAVEATAKQAASKTEMLWAQFRNTVGSPLRKVREFRKNRAEKSLERRQSRHDRKFGNKLSRIESRQESATAEHEAKIAQKQAQIDAMKDGWLKSKRQNKLESQDQAGKSKIENRFSAKRQRVESKQQRSQQKIHEFENGKVAHRRERHQRSAETAKSRIDGAETSAAERQKRIEIAREQAVSRKELAHARKALRKELRAQGATIRERREAMSELFQDDGDTSQLRDIGRKLVQANLAERSRQKSESKEKKLQATKENTENLLARGKETLQSLPGLLEQNAADQQKYAAMSEDLAEKIKGLSDVDDIDNLDYATFHQQKLEVDTALNRLRQDQLRMEEQLRNLPDKIATLDMKLVGIHDQLEAQQASVRSEYAASEAANRAYEDSVETVLNPQNKKEENK